MKAKTLVKAVVKPMKAAGHAKAVVKPMKAAGHAQMTKIRKAASDGKKRQVSMKASVAMKAPAAMKTPAMKKPVMQTPVMKAPAPMEAIAATFDKLTEGAATKREFMLRSAYEDEVEVRELLILQLQKMVRRYESLVRCYSMVPVADR